MMVDHPDSVHRAFDRDSAAIGQINDVDEADILTAID